MQATTEETPLKNTQMVVHGPFTGKNQASINPSSNILRGLPHPDPCPLLLQLLSTSLISRSPPAFLPPKRWSDEKKELGPWFLPLRANKSPRHVLEALLPIITPKLAPHPTCLALLSVRPPPRPTSVSIGRPAIQRISLFRRHALHRIPAALVGAARPARSHRLPPLTVPRARGTVCGLCPVSACSARCIEHNAYRGPERPAILAAPCRP